MKELTETEEYFLEVLETTGNLKDTAKQAGVSMSAARHMYAKVKSVIQERTKDRLTLASMRAASTVEELLNADGSTEKGELRLKTAESILDRSGATKHTNVDVQVETQNGLFILPSKSEVSGEPDDQE